MAGTAIEDATKAVTVQAVEKFVLVIMEAIAILRMAIVCVLLVSLGPIVSFHALLEDLVLTALKFAVV